jgi:hypothetical protein
MVAAINAMASKAKPQVVTAETDRGVIIMNRFCQSVATYAEILIFVVHCNTFECPLRRVQRLPSPLQHCNNKAGIVVELARQNPGKK